MPEYYGYQAPGQVDLGKSLANVAEMFNAAEEKRAAKRESEQKSLDESRKKINEIEQNSNQSQTELVGSGANKARDFILNLERMRKSGQITGAEFNRGMTNINDSWDSYAFTIKNMNERLAENIARQQAGEDGTPPPASANEIFNAKVQSNLMNTKNKDFMVAKDGTMYMIDKDDPSKPISLKSGGNIENIVDNRIDVPTLVSNGISNWGDFSVETGATTQEGARLQKELYDAAKYDLVHSIVDKKNPRAIVSILMDNAGEDYDQYYTKTEKEQLLNDAVTREEALKGPMTPEQKSAFRSDYEKNKMIEYVMDENGALQPVVTDKMINDAYNFVDQTVEMSVGSKTTEDEPRATTRGGGGGGGQSATPKVSDVEEQMVADARAAWKNNDVDALRRASNDQYFFVYSPDGGVNVFKTNPQKYKDAVAAYNREKAAWDKLKGREKENTPAPTAPKAKEAIAENIKGVDGLYPYFFGSGTTSMEKWKSILKKQREAEGGGGGNTPPKKKGAGDAVVQGNK